MSFGNGLALENFKSTESFFLQIYADSRETLLCNDYQEIKKAEGLQ